MNKTLSNKNIDTMGEAELRETFEQALAERFIPRSGVGCLTDHLLDLKRPELLDSAKFYMGAGYSKLKKAELAEAIADKVREHLSWIHHLCSDSVALMEKVIETSPCEKDPRLTGSMVHLMERHIVFPVMMEKTPRWAVPTDMMMPIKEALHHARAVKADNDKIVQLATGLIQVYGVLPGEEFVGLFMEAYGPCEDYHRVIEVLMENERFGAAYCFDPEIGFYHWRIENPKELQGMIAAREDLSYKAFSGEALIAIAEKGIHQGISEYESCVDYVASNWQQEVSVAADMVDEVIGNIQAGMRMNEALKPFTENLKFEEVDQLNELMGFAMAAYHASPQYFLKGHSPNELKALGLGNDMGPVQEPIRRESPKVGRNDFCPCGSGKKYKKCCEK